MLNKKSLILNISYFITIVLTLMLCAYEYFYYKNELQLLREIQGEGYYVVELFMLMVPISLLMMVAIETSIYFNLRYFIMNDNKTTIKTVFNILMLMSAVILFFVGFILDNSLGSVFSVSILILLVLRILYGYIG